MNYCCLYELQRTGALRLYLLYTLDAYTVLQHVVEQGLFVQ